MKNSQEISLFWRKLPYFRSEARKQKKSIDDTPTIYDKAIDKNYILTHIGSWKHRLFDGSHTPHEMW